MITKVAEMPIPPTSTRNCMALNRLHQPIGFFRCHAGECLVSAREGWFWSFTLMARVGKRYFPEAVKFRFDPFEDRKLQGIGRGWDQSKGYIADS